MRNARNSKRTRSLTHFGTYGFLSLMLSAQMAFADVADKVDRARVNNKENTRSEHTDLKKTVRKVKGKSSKVQDVKDRVSDARKDSQDEIHYGERKAKREAE